MTQEAINLFEKSGGKTGPSQFTDEATARETLGTRGTVASGRMSLTFASEMLRRYFGADVYNRRGTIDLRFLRPVRPGDTITLSGKVSAISKEPNGARVSVDVTATNQKGDVTAAGSGTCIVPSSCVPGEE
jgi:acyl dehydratase